MPNERLETKLEIKPRSSYKRLFRRCTVFLILVGLVIVAICIPQDRVNAQQNGVSVSVTATTENGFGRIIFDWPIVVRGSADLRNDILVLTFDRAFRSNLDPIRETFGRAVSLVRQDTDGRTLRIALRYDFETKTYTRGRRFIVDLIPPSYSGTPPAPEPINRPQPAPVAPPKPTTGEPTTQPPVSPPSPPPLPPVDLPIRVGQHALYTRIVFDWPVDVSYTVSPVRNNRASVTFDRAARVDLRRLRIDPPTLVQSANQRRSSRETTIQIVMSPETRIRHFKDGKRIVFDVLSPELFKTETPPETSEAKEEQKSLEPPNPVPKKEPKNEDVAPKTKQSGSEQIGLPDSGIQNGLSLVFEAYEEDQRLVLSFLWRQHTAANVFRRGDVVWVVFDREAVFDLSNAIDPFRSYVRREEQILHNERTVFRLTLQEGMLAGADANGNEWRITVGASLSEPVNPLTVKRIVGKTIEPRLIAELPGARAITWLTDPEAGDRIVSVAAVGPARGLLFARQYLELSTFESAHGFTINPLSDGLEVTIEEDLVAITREGGLRLAPNDKPEKAIGAKPAKALAGFMDFQTWARGGVPSFVANHRTLLAAMRDAEDETALKNARIDLARFYLANGYKQEAGGIIRIMTADDERILLDPAMRAMRGVINHFSGNYEDAIKDLSIEELNGDTAASLWRALSLAAKGQWAEARWEHKAGLRALKLHDAETQARFLLAETRSALALKDVAGASRALQQIKLDEIPWAMVKEAQLLRGQLAEAVGNTDDAIRAYTKVVRGGYWPLQVYGEFYRVRLRLENDLIPKQEAIERFERLRAQWRGDDLELKVLKELGRLYVDSGDIRKGLDIMRLAARHFPEADLTRDIGDQMSRIFTGLFLDGKADDLPPVQALALFYDFAELVPVGVRGDEMIRKLADRLIAVDLLEQAASLLDHQVRNRLKGVAAAQIATRLAMVYLMDHKPGPALQALRITRQTRLPDNLGRQRRLLEARSLSELERHDHALEVIEGEEFKGADTLRADILWAAEDWASAGRQFERNLEAVWQSAEPIRPQEQFDVLRAAIAYTLADNAEGLSRLRRKFAGKMSTTSDAQAFDTVTQQLDALDGEFLDVARQIGNVDTLESFLTAFRRQFTEEEQRAGESS